MSPAVRGQGAAFFDLDKTVIARSAMVAFGPALLRVGMITRRRALQAAWRNLVFGTLPATPARIERYRRSGQRIITGWRAARVEEIVAGALEEAIGPIVFAEALEEVERHRREGRPTVLASAGPIEIVDQVARLLGFDHALASVATIDADGRYTGDATAWLHGTGKAEAVRAFADEQGLDLAASWAYSDARSDLPFLSLVGNPVAVNPERPLARAARERGWPTVRWTRRDGLRASRAPITRSAGAPSPTR
jgi:HAD superfamily hydrolase (TIGR01490 family)